MSIRIIGNCYNSDSLLIFIDILNMKKKKHFHERKYSKSRSECFENCMYLQHPKRNRRVVAYVQKSAPDVDRL